jgi:hypothetical protein
MKKKLLILASLLVLLFGCSVEVKIDCLYCDGTGTLSFGNPYYSLDNCSLFYGCPDVTCYKCDGKGYYYVWK